MSLIPYQPFWDLNKFFEEDWPGIWENPRSDWKLSAMRIPRIDIYEDKGNVVVEVGLPGIDPKNIELEVKDNVLKVEGKIEKKKQEKGKGYYRKELSYGYYKRIVALPVKVIGERADAVYEGGILKVVIPKKEKKEIKTKKIKVKIKTKAKKVI